MNKNNKIWYGFNVLWFFSAGWGKEKISPKLIHINEKELDFMAAMGCNFVRVPVDYRFFIHDFKYDEYDENMLCVLDNAIRKITERGLHCSLNVHRAPGYCINGNELEKDNLWTDVVAQNAFTNLWKMFAKRYVEYSEDELSFDLLNEPPNVGQYGMNRENHKAIMTRVVLEIRNISCDREIICDGIGCGHIATPELSDLGVTLSGRGYNPIQLTHWNAEWMVNNGSMDWEYPQWPGMKIDGVEWNRNRLKEFYKPWKDLADKGCKVHIGECGVYDKVDNKTALAWYKDFFGVCNELGFGWALWNFSGPFGITEHRRKNTNWKIIDGIKVDSDLYELYKNAMKK